MEDRSYLCPSMLKLCIICNALDGKLWIQMGMNNDESGDPVILSAENARILARDLLDLVSEINELDACDGFPEGMPS